MELKAFEKLTCGLYIVSTAYQGKKAGCVVNTVTQVTNSPCQVMVAINKQNFTTQMVQKAGVFHVTALTEDVPLPLIGCFGYQTSAEVDKFADFEESTDKNGCPYVAEGAAAEFTCKLVQQLDVGTHMLLVGEVEDARILSQQTPMSYSYYHTVKKGKTPPKASSYNPEEDN